METAVACNFCTGSFSYTLNCPRFVPAQVASVFYDNLFFLVVFHSLHLNYFCYFVSQVRELVILCLADLYVCVLSHLPHVITFVFPIYCYNCNWLSTSLTIKIFCLKMSVICFPSISSQFLKVQALSCAMKFVSPSLSFVDSNQTLCPSFKSSNNKELKASTHFASIFGK